MSGSTYTVIGGVITIIGAGFALVGGYMSSQQKAATDKALIAGNAELKVEVANAKNALIAKGDELSAVQGQLSTTQAALVAKTDENAALQKGFADYAMGADSYFYLHLVAFGRKEPQAVVIHVGKNPVRRTQVVVQDITNQMPDIFAKRNRTIDLLGPPRRDIHVEESHPTLNSVLTQYLFESNPVAENYFYLVRFYNGNGTYRQILNLAKVDGNWKQAYFVERIVDDTSEPEPVGQFFDPDFPLGPTHMAKKPGYPELKLKGLIKQHADDRR